MNDKLLKEIKRKLDMPLTLSHQAATLGFDIFLLVTVYGIQNKEQSKNLIESYYILLKKNNLADVLLNQIQYAIRLARDEGDLLYEEMHKLFSLCDEVYALKSIGLKVEDSIYKNFEDAIRYRFKRELRKSHLVAEDKLEDWNKELWWYSENI